VDRLPDAGYWCALGTCSILPQDAVPEPRENNIPSCQIKIHRNAGRIWQLSCKHDAVSGVTDLHHALNEAVTLIPNASPSAGGNGSMR